MTLNLNMNASEEKIAGAYVQAFLKQLKEKGVQVTMELAIQKNGYTDLGKVEEADCACGSSCHLIRNAVGHYEFRCEECQGKDL